ncbi:MAG: DUF3459 domain-containing protein [Deltaproteobacteria bacterium]|nr:DUF3459 domain-containing protein [Deltaproteobacteria bacterium]
MSIPQNIEEHLARLYGKVRGADVARDLRARLKRRGGTSTSSTSSTSHVAPSRVPTRSRRRLTERDAVLITYGDSLRSEDKAPLPTLGAFATAHLKDAFSTLHLLPFFPFSSDDGFSVTDFGAVDPALGTWNDIATLRDAGFDLVFDLVCNHLSSQSSWFRAYLAGDPAFADLAIAMDPETDLSAVTRPRTSPLLTPFTRPDGSQVTVWTTFSADQVDLNYQNPDVLLRIIDVILDYIDRGATILRLDAVGFLWKRHGTSCMHLPETHEVIRLLRSLLDEVAPEVLLLTETNVPHDENISYFGGGHDEAQVVYNFSLPPLLLHALTHGDGRALSAWAAALPPPHPGTTFLNFTASHDGVGLRPLEGLLPQDAIDALADLTTRRGGHVSYRTLPDGQTRPYELNVTYVDALRGKDESGGDTSHVARLVASQAIALSLPGVPAVYIGTLLGHRNWHEGVSATGQPRTINRQKVLLKEIEPALGDPTHFRARVFTAITHLLQVRRRQPAFSPDARARVLALDSGVFTLVRQSGAQTLLALTNLTDKSVSLHLPRAFADAPLDALLAPHPHDTQRDGHITLAPYETCWLSTDVPLDLDDSAMNSSQRRLGSKSIF